MSEDLTYARAGVDIRKEARAVNALVATLGGQRRGDVQPLRMPGLFAGAMRFGETALVLCTDGVGSKVLIADALKVYDTVGIDCMAMNVNDAIAVGAEPVAFVDYLAVHHPDEHISAEIGKGLAEGARQANVSIIGGETATLPELVHSFDLAGTCLAIAPVDGLITGQGLQEGDIVLGLPSSGVHSNGLTLARKAMERAGIAFTDEVPDLGMRAGDALLTPTKIYVDQVLAAVRAVKVRGLVHVTGGGLLNFLRIHDELGFDLTGWPQPPVVFQILQRWGNVPDLDMWTTFNNGIGFALVVHPDDVDAAMKALGPGAIRLGTVVTERGVRVPWLEDLVLE